MLWIYRRDNQELRIEAQAGAVDREYVIRVLWPGGHEQFEILSGDAAFCLRLTEFESQLREQKWIGPAGPILNDGAEWRFSEPNLPDRRAQRDRRRLTRRDRRSPGSATAKRDGLPNTMKEDEDR